MSKRAKKKSTQEKAAKTDPLIRKVNKWCREGEGLTIQFKQSLSSLKGEDIVAMANAEGGFILLGIEEHDDDGVKKGRVVGVTNLEKIRRAVNRLCTSCSPPVRPRIQRVNHSKGTVVITGIEKALAVTCSGDGAYVIRLTRGRQALDPERLKQRFFEQESTAFLNQFRSASSEIVALLEKLSEAVQEDLRSLSKNINNLEHLTTSVEAGISRLNQAEESLVHFRQSILGELEEIKRRLHRIEIQV